MMSLGLERGDKVCVIGDNDPQYFWAQLGVQSAGGVSVGIFTDSAPAQIQYIAAHSDATFVFAKDLDHIDYWSHDQETEGIGNHKNTIDDPVLFLCPSDAFLKIRSENSKRGSVNI